MTSKKHTYIYFIFIQCLLQMSTYASSTNPVPHHSWHGWHELKIRDVTKCSVESVRGGDTCFHSFGILCVNKLLLLLLLHLIYMYLRHYYLKIYANSLSYFTVHLPATNSHHNNLHFFAQSEGRSTSTGLHLPQPCCGTQSYHMLG